MPFAKNSRMSQWVRSPLIAALIVSVGVVSCSESSPEETSSLEASETGTLNFTANGEDFIRQGFTTKDQWQVSFEHVYVTLDQVSAHPSSLTADAANNVIREEKRQPVTVDAPVTVDLAAGDETAEPILIASVPAPAGHYRGLSFALVPATTGPIQGSSLSLIGQAQKDGQSLRFALQLNPEISFRCGDFVGEERKGVLKAGQTADMEATFHFDHLFGDGDAPTDAEINMGALGFSPIAQLAQGEQVTLDMPALMADLSAADAEKLQTLLLSLGHVGEGHCEASRR